jgi:acetyl-CoA C-acetyltransferase
MREVVIVQAVRTPIGRLGGTLWNVPGEELARPVLSEALARAGVSPDQVDEVILGQTKQTADAANVARVAALKAGLPVSVPAYTVHRQCGSGMQAVLNAFQAIALGHADVLLAGGVESMSTAPYYLRNARYGYGVGNAELLDPNTESQPGSQPTEGWGRLTMGATAELLAQRYRIARTEQDEFALESQTKAHQAIHNGSFAGEIVPVVLPAKKGEALRFEVDEHPRQTSLEVLAGLKPAFQEGGTVTAGNSSGRSDGASALLLMAAETAQRLGIKPMARIRGLGVAAVTPELMGLGPVTASQRALTQAGLSLSDMGLVELNEAFAAQVLAVLRELPVSRDRLNVHGGAIALGHPIGNSGARILVTLLHAMRQRQIQFGLATLCAAGGQGMTTVVETII